MQPQGLTSILQLLIIVWAIEQVLRRHVEKARGEKVALSSFVRLLALVLVGVTFVSPPEGAVILTGVIALHGLTVAPLLCVGRSGSQHGVGNISRHPRRVGSDEAGCAKKSV